MDTIGAFIDPIGAERVRARRDKDLAKAAEKGQLRKKQAEDKQRDAQRKIQDEYQDAPAPARDRAREYDPPDDRLQQLFFRPMQLRREQGWQAV
jgi:hypothetical protein